MKWLPVRWMIIGFSVRAWRSSIAIRSISAPSSTMSSSRLSRSWSSWHEFSPGTRPWGGRRRLSGTNAAIRPENAYPGLQRGAEQRGQAGAARVTVIYDEFFLRHRPPPGHAHPECPARVSTARQELDGLKGIEWATPSSLRSAEDKAKTLTAIERLHKSEYLDEVRRVCAKGGGAADFDTYICPDSFEVCVAASSAWMDATELASRGSPAFALARPPGHHATAGVGMGFCLVCFASVAAFHAVEALGCNRVAMLDFDVHHGNGVAALVKREKRIRYCSIHQGGIFPGSGVAEDKGPLGNLKHMPFYGLGETWETYEPLFEESLAWLQDFDPDLVIVSAGYDALEADELATASLQPEDYGRMARRLKEVFGTKVAFGLEGGYNLEVTPVAIRETIRPFLEPGV